MKSTRAAVNLTVYVALAASLPATLCRAADSATTTTWLKLSPATSPSARSGPGMAYDPAQKLIVLFGGAAIGHNPDYLNDKMCIRDRPRSAQRPLPREPAALTL